MILSHPTLKEGETILVDFDGFICQENRPEGGCYYPHCGPPMPGIKNFLNNCKITGIVVCIWSARTNSALDIEKFPIQGNRAFFQITDYMKIHNLYYTSICMDHKPLGKHFAKYLFDNNSFDKHDHVEFL